MNLIDSEKNLHCKRLKLISFALCNKKKSNDFKVKKFLRS